MLSCDPERNWFRIAKAFLIEFDEAGVDFRLGAILG